MRKNFNLCVLCILVLCLMLVVNMTFAREVNLNSTLIQGRYALPGQRVTFTCEARGGQLMVWLSPEYIGVGGDLIEIFSGDDGSNQTRLGGTTVATRVSIASDNGITVIVSQLHITASEQFPMSSVTCRINSRGPNQTINFNITDIRALQGVNLNSTLIQGRYALPGQRVTFTCEARGGQLMVWLSPDYIGVGGDLIEIFSGDDGSNQTRLGGTTVATRVSIASDNGITVIVSQLHITASEQFPTSSVTCRINSRGPNQTINFITTDTIPRSSTTADIKEPVRSTTVAMMNDDVSTENNRNPGCNCVGLITGVVVGAIIVAIVAGITCFCITFLARKKRRGRQVDNSVETAKSMSGTNAVDTGSRAEKGEYVLQAHPMVSISTKFNDPSGLRAMLNPENEVHRLKIEKERLEKFVKELKRQLQEREAKEKRMGERINDLEKENEQLKSEQKNVKELEAELEKLEKELQQKQKEMSEKQQLQPQLEYERMLKKKQLEDQQKQ